MFKVGIIAVVIISAVLVDCAFPLEKSWQITNTVNSARTTWTAHPFQNQKYTPIASSSSGSQGVSLSTFLAEGLFRLRKELPENFDAREKWPECPSIRRIYNQGQCRACWAIGAVSAFTDRICIKSGGRIQAPRSVQHVLSCSMVRFGMDGCSGGSATVAMMYLVTHGVVTGGEYPSQALSINDGCQPWPVQPCTYSVHNRRIPQCDQVPFRPAGACQEQCYNPTYPTPFHNDRIKASKFIRRFHTLRAVQKEIFNNGPIVTWFNGYEDIYMYKTGVYQQITGDRLPDHCVRVLGWGVENGVPYWLAANTQDEYWGENGFFKIIRGKNHLGFEENFTAPLV